MNFHKLVPYLGHFIEPFFITVLVSISAAMITISIGMISTFARLSNIRIFTWLSVVYLFICRGTPALIQLFLIFYGLPKLGFNIPAVPAGIIALSLYHGAFAAEAIRGGINAVSRGEIQAAHSLGFNYFQTMCYIVMPQAVRNMLPSLTNELLHLVKNTSLLSIVGIIDLTTMANTVRANSYLSLETFLFISVIYLMMTTVISNITRRFERKKWASTT